jgi:hypothetical protein
VNLESRLPQRVRGPAKMSRMHLPPLLAAGASQCLQHELHFVRRRLFVERQRAAIQSIQDRDHAEIIGGGVDDRSYGQQAVNANTWAYTTQPLAQRSVRNAGLFGCPICGTFGASKNGGDELPSKI